MNWERYGKKWSWPTRNYNIISLDIMRENTKELIETRRCSDRDSNRARPEYENVTSTQTRSVWMSYGVAMFSCRSSLSVTVTSSMSRGQNTKSFPEDAFGFTQNMQIPIFILVWRPEDKQARRILLHRSLPRKPPWRTRRHMLKW
jgi:hypothetical protein